MNKSLKKMLLAAKWQMLKGRILPALFFMVVSAVCITSINPQAYAQGYVRLTNGTASAFVITGVPLPTSLLGPVGNVFDSNTSTAWGWSLDTSEPFPGLVIMFSLPTPQTVTKYRILGGNLDSWQLRAVISGSGYPVLLHSGSASNVGQEITISNTTAYSYYYLFLTGVAYHSIPVPLFVITELEYYVNNTQASPSASFSASPTTINQGASSTLTWSTTNATSVSFSPSIGSTALNGSKTVTPSSTTTYTMTATGPGGAITKTATVTVNSAQGKGVTYIYDELGRIKSITRVK